MPGRAQRPVLLSIDGEARSNGRKRQGGVYIPPEEPGKMAQALLALKHIAC